MEAKSGVVGIVRLGVVVACGLLGVRIDLAAVPAAPANLSAAVSGTP